ncbi:MAG: OmpA family protein [Phycisphaeraceae bacterium]|nr:OmpA family protein [Phycisphaeraceae bacterium]
MSSTRTNRTQTRARRALAFALIAAPALGLFGCASQGELDRRDTAIRSVEERNVALQQDIKAKDAIIAQLRSRVSASDESMSDLRSRNAELQSQLLTSEEDLRNFGQRLGQVASMIDPTTERALRRLAQNNSEIFGYDANRGMVQLKSDLTFASGSAELTASARSGLQQLAQILTGADASNYDLMIVGHTDNVPISNPATRKSHPTNMHLAAHRAISVQEALASFGMSPTRMEIAGWGEYRPVVANPAKGGAAANRRVEIFLRPSTMGAYSATGEPMNVKPKSQQTNADDFPMK